MGRFVALFGRPAFLRRFHAYATWQWAAHFPVVVCLYVFERHAWTAASILYLALVSVYANMVGHWSSWQAARVEVKQEEQIEENAA